MITMTPGIRTGWYPAPMLPQTPAEPQNSPGSTSAAPAAPQTTPAGATSVAAASVSRDVTASLSITTKDGDTVSISASLDATATYANLRGGGLKASSSDVSATSQFSVQVQGTLSRQEMHDISRVVRTFLHDLRAMMKGRDVSVANVANGDPKTLQSVSANAQTQTTITAVAGNFQPAPPEATGANGAPRGVALPEPAPEPVSTTGTPTTA